MRDQAVTSTALEVRRWDARQVAEAARRLGLPPWREPDAEALEALGTEPGRVTRDEDCNMILAAGWAAMLGGIAGTDMSPKLSATACRAGIGTGTAAPAWGQTALTGDTGSGSVTSWYQLASAAPVISAAASPATLTIAASFGTTAANFAWNEFGIDNYTASGPTTTGLGAGYLLLNRGVSAQGTKAAGEVWAATVIISLGYPSAAGTVT